MSKVFNIYTYTFAILAKGPPADQSRIVTISHKSKRYENFDPRLCSCKELFWDTICAGLGFGLVETLKLAAALAVTCHFVVSQ